MPYLTWDDLVAAGVSEARLREYAPGDTPEAHPLIDRAILEAAGEMDEYLRRRGIVVPLDTPLSPTMAAHLASLVLDYRTLRFDRRPQAIAENAAMARAFFEKIATGKQSVEDTNPATAAGSAPILSSAEIRVHSVFDSTDPSSDISRMFPPLGGRGHRR